MNSTEDLDYIFDSESQDFRRRIWQKAKIVNNYNPDLYRKDATDAWIAFDSFGDAENTFGWGIDHILPISMGGDGEHEVNLRPLNLANIRSKAEQYPRYLRAVTSQGINNVEIFDFVTVNQSLQNLLKEIYKI